MDWKKKQNLQRHKIWKFPKMWILCGREISRNGFWSRDTLPPSTVRAVERSGNLKRLHHHHTAFHLSMLGKRKWLCYQKIRSTSRRWTEIKNFNGSTPCVTTTMYILGLFYIPPDHWKVHRLRFSRLLLHLEEKSREGNLLHTWNGHGEIFRKS